MRIAFYAPMKAPDDPVPSGDRHMARLVRRALAAAGYEPWTASRLSTLDLGGDPVRQRVLARASMAEVEGILAGLGTASPQEQPAAWVTYHVYYKAPDWIGPGVAKALDIPYLVVEGSRAPKRARGPHAFSHGGAEAALDQARVIFYLTEKDREVLERLRPPGQQLLKLPPFLDLESWPERPETGGGGFNLLTVAMMRAGDKLASYRLLAEALALLDRSDWRLDIVGDGPARPEVEQAFAPFGARVRFHGLTESGTALAAHYAAADLFLWPAVNEAFGMVFLEAQAYGTPPIAGHYGGTADVILHGETGLLVPPGDARAFAAAVAELMDAEERRLALGGRARLFVRGERTLAAASTRLAEGLALAGVPAPRLETAG